MGDKLVLVVENSIPQGNRLRNTLEREGYAVELASTGKAALVLTESMRPEVIVCDETLPDTDGCSLCNSIHSNPATKAIPIMLMTGLSDREDIIPMIRAGVSVLLPKPCDELTLLSQISRLVQNDNARGRDAENFLDVPCSQLIQLLKTTYTCAAGKNQELQATERKLKEATAELLTLQRNYMQLLETNVDAILIYDAQGIVHYANAAAIKAFSVQGIPLIHEKTPFDLAPDSVNEIEISDAEGQVTVLDGRAVDTEWNGEVMTLASFRNVTEASRLRKELEQMSLTDDLSGLYNRRGFSILAERMIPQAKRLNCHLFVMFADIDSLKSVNDTYGHREGDKLICMTATLFRQSFRETDIIARMGGDEFAIMGIVNDSCIPSKLIDRLEQSIATFNASRQYNYRLSLSLGVEKFDPCSSEPLEFILKKADMFMYANKQTKKQARQSE
ncbi:MAG: diguanylate cyclase [Spirochaetaceae bacterium]|nr:diguanylate cyclase [Spirochaetaceae bacterium]